MDRTRQVSSLLWLTTRCCSWMEVGEGGVNKDPNRTRQCAYVSIYIFSPVRTIGVEWAIFLSGGSPTWQLLDGGGDFFFFPPSEGGKKKYESRALSSRWFAPVRRLLVFRLAARRLQFTVATGRAARNISRSTPDSWPTLGINLLPHPPHFFSLCRRRCLSCRPSRLRRRPSGTIGVCPKSRPLLPVTEIFPFVADSENAGYAMSKWETRLKDSQHKMTSAIC